MGLFIFMAGTVQDKILSMYIQGKIVMKTARKTCDAEGCCHVLNISFKDQKPTIMFFGDTGTSCFVEKNEL